jgi:addiction module HigA family antidote
LLKEKKNYAGKEIRPIHPGEVLLEEFLKPMDLSQKRLASAIAVPPRRVNEIVLGKRGITANTALRLGRYFGMSPQFWLGLQIDYDLDRSADSLEKRYTPESALADCKTQAELLFENQRCDRIG